MGGTLTHPLQTSVKCEKHLLAKGFKSLSTPSSADLPGGSLMQLSKVQNRFNVPKLHPRTHHPHLEREVFISDQSRTESCSMFPIGVRVVNGNMINNYTNSKFPSLNTPQAPQPLPPVLSLCRVFWFKFHCSIRQCYAVLVSPPTSFFWPWRVSAPELDSALSTPSCDIRLSSFSCRVRKLIRNPQWGQNLSPKSFPPDHVTEIRGNIKTKQLV